MLAFNILFMIKWNRHLHQMNVSYTHRLSFGGYREQQISTCICISREFSVLAQCVLFFFFWKTVLPVFHLTRVDLLPAHFQKCSDAKLIRGCFAFQQLLQAGVFSLFLHPLPPPSTLTPSLTCNPSNKQTQGYNVSSH